MYESATKLAEHAAHRSKGLLLQRNFANERKLVYGLSPERERGDSEHSLAVGVRFTIPVNC